MLERCVPASAILAAGLFLVVVPVSRADILVTPPGNVSVQENGGAFRLDVAVTNTDKFERILDFALATITPNGPDLMDTAYFSGNAPGGAPNGNMGLITAPTFLLPGQTGIFSYSLRTVAEGPQMPPDFGLNTFSFAIEMSPFTSTVPIPTPLPMAQNILFYNPTIPGALPDANVVAQLKAGQVPNTLLYSTGQFGNPYPATSQIQVYDTGFTGMILFGPPAAIPEPSPLILAGLGGLVLLGGFTYRARARRIVAA